MGIAGQVQMDGINTLAEDMIDNNEPAGRPSLLGAGLRAMERKKAATVCCWAPLAPGRLGQRSHGQVGSRAVKRQKQMRLERGAAELLTGQGVAPSRPATQSGPAADQDGARAQTSRTPCIMVFNFMVCRPIQGRRQRVSWGGEREGESPLSHWAAHGINRGRTGVESGPRVALQQPSGSRRRNLIDCSICAFGVRTRPPIDTSGWSGSRANPNLDRAGAN